MLTVPDGSAESFTDVVDWVAINMAYPLSEWQKVRNRAASMGIRVFPWTRLCHLSQGEGWEILKQRLSLLMATALAMDENIIIPNYEDEASAFKPDDVGAYLYGDADWNGDTGWSTLAWLQNDFGWESLGKRDPALLQIFPKDNRWPYDSQVIAEKMGDCVAHARDEGFTYVGVTYQTYDSENGNGAWLYNTDSYMHSTFTGNVINHGEWESWYN